MKLTKSILLTSCFFLLYACGEYKLESEENETVQDEQTEARYTLQLNVTSRNNAKINYPLSLFLFDDENNCVVRETIPTEESEFSSSISKGKYTLILLSGLNENDHSYPLEIIPDSYISLKTDNCSEEPLQIGKASVNLTQSTRITVILSYAVASLNFTLNGIPQDVTATEVKVSPVSSAVSFNGDYKNDKQQCVIPCRKAIPQAFFNAASKIGHSSLDMAAALDSGAVTPRSVSTFPPLTGRTPSKKKVVSSSLARMR